MSLALASSLPSCQRPARAIGARICDLRRIAQPATRTGKKGYIESFAILTTNAAPAIAHLHHRQPVVLDQDGVEACLDADSPLDEVLAIAQTPARGRYEIWPVDHAVGDPGHTPAEVVKALAA